MKIHKKVTACVVGTLISLLLCAGSAHAIACNDVLLEEVGMLPRFSPDPNSNLDDYFVRVKCNSGWTNSMIFYLSTDLGKSGYATLLTAQATGKHVNLELGAYTWFSLVNEIRLLDH